MSDKKRVIITIERGIPEVLEAPDGVDVLIRDYDTWCYSEDELEEDEEGRKYFPREG
jgi:hypothetical protein